MINSIPQIAGDYIEHSLGAIMTISTMAAAALGNTISDVFGIGSAVYVERIVELIGIKPPDLTPVQLEMKSARRACNMVGLISNDLSSHAFGNECFLTFSQQGRVLGITAGCILGMIPLLFFKDKVENEEDEKKDEKSSNSNTNSDSKKQESVK